MIDEHSPASIMGGTATYSTTDSYYYGIFAKLHFGRDDHRLLGGIGKGKVRNNYDDFLGSGLPVQTTDDLDVLALRYYKRIKGNWYLGPQGISTNYAISGDNWLSGKIIELIGMTGFKSNGLGLALQYDSRDNQNSPSSGQVFQLHNIAYRQSLGGETSFDAYHADYKFFLGHGKDHVLAFHIQGRWSHNAPSSGYSSVGLRGYVRGQYLAPHMTMMEIEERFSLNKKWGLVAFGGVAGLYGNDRNRDQKEDLFPAGGGGISYLLNDEKMVGRAEYAIGKEGNQGFYMTFGQPF
ncbi:MAG: hypothetical protein HUN05_12805 [Desulfobacter sp.]|nr:MAG: hypothetical protein HUN05_12805 [Desulfobacter sp.]